MKKYYLLSVHVAQKSESECNNYEIAQRDATKLKVI